MNKENQLSHRFDRLSSFHPNVGSYIVLRMAVRGMNYPRHKIYSAFNKYVPKKDYDEKDRDNLMVYLERISLGGKKYGLTEPNEKVEMPSLIK
jgi:hypothetical protein